MNMEKLANQIRVNQEGKDPIDETWLREAVTEYFQARTTRNMFINLDYGIKAPRRRAIGRGVYEYDIPKTWEMRVISWALKEGFYATSCRGTITLEI